MRGKFSKVQPLANMNGSYVHTFILCCGVYLLTQCCVLYLSINTHKQVTEHLCDAQAQICWFFLPV